jgi:hypothetical protein
MCGAVRGSAPVNSHEERDEAMKSMLVIAAMLMATSTVTMAQDEVQVPKEALQEMAFLVGEWKVKGTFNGEEMSGTYSAKWAPGKHCLILTSSWSAHASGIGGWSPDRKQYVEYWYAANGNKRTFRYSLDKEKGVWDGTWTEINSEGKKGSGKISLQKKDNEFIVIATGETRNPGEASEGRCDEISVRQVIVKSATTKVSSVFLPLVQGVRS